jgi:hypothetical protein
MHKPRPHSLPPPRNPPQDEIIDAICRELESTLLAAMSSRTFATNANTSAAATSIRLAEVVAKQQASAAVSGAARQGSGGSGGGPPAKPSPPPAYRPDKLVRSDHRMRTMDAFVVRGSAAAGGLQGSGAAVAGGAPAAGPSGRGEAAGAAAERQGGGGQQQGASAAALAAVGDGVPRKRRAAERDRLSFSSSMVAAAAAGSGAQDEEIALRGEDGGAGPQQQGTVRPVRQRANPPGPPPVPAAAALLAAREGSCHEGLWALVRQHVFVGLADEAGEWALLQHGTRLYLLAAGPLSRDLFEQQLLRRWGRCPAAALEEPLVLEAVAQAGLEVEAAEGRWTVGAGRQG